MDGIGRLYQAGQIGTIPGRAIHRVKENADGRYNLARLAFIVAHKY
jgi:hypothetical protein